MSFTGAGLSALQAHKQHDLSTHSATKKVLSPSGVNALKGKNHARGQQVQILVTTNGTSAAERRKRILQLRTHKRRNSASMQTDQYTQNYLSERNEQRPHALILFT